jgi:hypothetical protein
MAAFDCAVKRHRRRMQANKPRLETGGKLALVVHAAIDGRVGNGPAGAPGVTDNGRRKRRCSESCLPASNSCTAEEVSRVASSRSTDL